MFTRILRDAGVTTLSSYRWEQPPSSGIDLEHAANTATAIAGFRHSVGTAVSRAGVPGHRIPDGYRLVDEDPDQYGFLVAHAQAVQTCGQPGYRTRGRGRGGGRAAPPGLGQRVLGLPAPDRGHAAALAGRGPWFHRHQGRPRGRSPHGHRRRPRLDRERRLLALVGPSSAFGSRALRPERRASPSAAEALALVLLAAMAALMTARERRASRPPLPNAVEGALRAHRDRSVPLALAVPAERLARSRRDLRSGRPERLPDHAAAAPPQRVDPLRPAGQHRPAAGPPAHAATRPFPLAGWLAVRRLAAAPSLGMLMVGSVALAVGAFTYAGAIARSQEYTLSAKAQTLVGSNTAVTVPHLVRLPPSLAANATEVLAETSGTVGSAPVIVIGVNPSSFENGAFWDSSYSGQSLGQLMQGLAAAPVARTPIPVIAGGPAGFSLRPGVLLPYSTPAVARPGARRRDGLDLPRTERERPDPDHDSGPSWRVSTRPLSTRSGRRTRRPTSRQRSGARHRLHLGAVGHHRARARFSSRRCTGRSRPWGPWACWSGILAFAGLFLFLTARSRARALSYALGLKMGVSRRTHLASLGIEIGMLFGAALVIGMATAWLATTLVNGGTEPLSRRATGVIDRRSLGRHRHHADRGDTGAGSRRLCGPST